MAKKINPCNLDEQASKILSQFLIQTNKFVSHKGNLVVNIEGENISFELTHTLVCRPRIENTPQKAGYRYEVMSKQCLGAGGFGEVYPSIVTLGLEQGKLFPILNGKSRVIKVQEKIDGQEEAYFSRKAPHLHMKPMVIDEEKQKSFLVFKKMPGETLDNILDKHRLNIDQKIQLSRQIVHAYQQQVLKPGLVHRDLKPENIMVDFSQQNAAVSEVNIIDFGLAKQQKDSDQGDYVGSFCYMAPEVLRGRGSQVASDIYALGCIFKHVFAPESQPNDEEIYALTLLHDQIVPKDNQGAPKKIVKHNQLIWKSKLGLDRIQLDEMDIKKQKQLLNLLRKMMDINPEERMSIEKVDAELLALQTNTKKERKETMKKCLFFTLPRPKIKLSFLQQKIGVCLPVH